MKYDLSNEECKEQIEILCLANLPIEFYSEKMRHLTIREIISMGETYSRLLVPFTFSRDMLPKDYRGEFYVLELLLVLDMEYLNGAIELLKLLFSTEKVRLFKEEIIINDRLFIDKYKFEELKNIILLMFNLQPYKRPKEDGEKRLTLEQIDKIQDPREKRYQMRIYEKYKKEQRDKNKSVSLYNVYNYISNYNGIDYEKPLGFNVYQLYNTFGVLHKKENYNYTMRIASSGMVSDVKKLDLRPLSQQIADNK